MVLGVLAHVYLPSDVLLARGRRHWGGGQGIL